MHTNTGIESPLVSIGLPVYNGASYLDEAISSVLSQTFADFELVISDNDSSDGTHDICMGYAAKDNRIRYYRNSSNLGAAYNYNRVFDLSRGKYFKWIAADDVLLPRFLEECVRLLETEQQLILAYTRLKVMDDYGGTGIRDGTMRYEMFDLQCPRTSERFRQVVLLLVPCVYPIWGLIRSDILSQSRLIQPHVGADHCLLADLILRGRFGEVPDYLMLGRWSRESYGGKLYTAIQAGGTEGAEQAEWYAPASSERAVFPNWRRLKEYTFLVLRSGAGVTETLRMLVYIGSAAMDKHLLLQTELRCFVSNLFASRISPRVADILALSAAKVFGFLIFGLRAAARLLGWHRWVSPRTRRASR